MQPDYSDNYLRRYLEGELPEEEAMALRQVELGDAALQNRIEKLEMELVVGLEKLGGDGLPSESKKNLFGKLESLEGGPLVSEASVELDFQPKVDESRTQMPKDFGPKFVAELWKGPKRITFFVALRDGAEEEVHSKCIESFYVLGGTCEVITEAKTYYMKKGDYLAIPLHVSHSVVVTSEEPCEFICQRRYVA